ncbi:MAG: OsmC family protein [Planctomycetes bacterium]|nr:OsmC family protein [Planctomycetota bacterium]
MERCMSLITIKHEDGLRFTVSIRDHKITVDAPANQGGGGQGPAPVEMLTSALGACMAMHVAKYCQTAKLPHQGFTLDLAYEMATDPLRVGSVTVDITMPPGIPDKRKEAIKRAALHCAVRNTLKETTAVDVEVGE